MKVCILAAGLGTRMGALSQFIHKALLPLGNRAVISHIIETFGETCDFVIALGNKAELVESFVRVAHPGIKVSFVHIDPYEGPNSGPGTSLFQCRHLLDEPFCFTACDTLISSPLPPFTENWIGVSPVEDPQNWCAVDLEPDRRVKRLEYKVPGSRANWAFTGIAFVKDHAEFWQGMAAGPTDGAEVQVNDGLVGLIDSGLVGVSLDWQDTGNWEAYQKLLPLYGKNFSFVGKTTEFTYLYDGGRVVKLYPTATKAETWVRRGRALGDAAPTILDQDGPALAYAFVPGDLFSHELNRSSCRRFLEWMDATVWRKPVEEGEPVAGVLRTFYLDKTLDRLADFYNKVPQWTALYHQAITINGLTCQPTETLLRTAEPALLEGAIPSVFHGDLHGDNIIVTQNSYCLIDWRDSFSGLSVGDRYYDLAKFLHTLDFSVEAMESDGFKSEITGTEVRINHDSKFNDIEAREAFFDFLCDYAYDRDRAEILNAVIFLNMAPLYEPELGSYLYFLGRYKLQSRLSDRTPRPGSETNA